MNGFLRQQQRKEYQHNGFLFPIEVLSETGATQHNRRLEAIESQHGPMHYRVKPYLVFSSAWEIATNVQLLDAVESILGAT